MRCGTAKKDSKIFAWPYDSPAAATPDKPFGEFDGCIGGWDIPGDVAKSAHVEHWLNGIKLLEYELWIPDWEAKVKASKFVDYPHYGRAARGYIGIQGDHDGELSLRNIRIRTL